MNDKILDEYCRFLACSTTQTSATVFSEVVGSSISHDKLTRYLAEANLDNKTIWKTVRPIIRQFEKIGIIGDIAIDDTVIPKPHMDESEIICYWFDNNLKKIEKGMRLFTIFYIINNPQTNESIKIPLAIEVLKKDVPYQDEETGQQKFKSSKTIHEVMRDLIKKQVILNQIKFNYILGDSGFSTVENIIFIEKLKRKYIFTVKSNRKVAENLKEKHRGLFYKLDQLNLPEGISNNGYYLHGLDKYPVKVIRQVFRNKDKSEGERFLITNDKDCRADQVKKLYRERWGIEEYHKSLKQNCSISKSPAQRVRSQLNHVFASILTYIKLEVIRMSKNGLNHFATKSKMYKSSLKVAMEEFRMFEKFIAFA